MGQQGHTGQRGHSGRRRTVHTGRRNSLAARAAVARWAWRLFRREWSQHLLVLVLLTVAVATATAGATVVYHEATPDEARFGDAPAVIRIEVADPRRLAGDLARIDEVAGPIDVIGHRLLPVPGSVLWAEARSQDPSGPLGAPMLALVTGRYPAGPGEAAVTAGHAELLQVTPGDRLRLGGGEPERTVVGVVENPHDLTDEFVLLAPSPADQPEAVTVLVSTAAMPLDLGPGAGMSHRTQDPLYAALAVLLVTTVGMLLVCLIAGASFVVIAQRRLRQLGMLAAIGATRRQLRLVTVAGGVLTGVVATGLGTGLGLAVWLALAPGLETVVNHRIDPLAIPWWAVLTCAGLALLTAAGAAWWPARVLSRVPVVQALAARPPRPRPTRRSGVVAAVLLAIGGTLLVVVDQTRSTGFHTGLWELAFILGTVLTVVGVLFVSPLAIRLLAAAGTRAPLPVRLALRDLGRYRARSAAALAAITLGLAVTVFFVVTAAAVAYAEDEGNLSDRQLLVWVEGDWYAPERSPAELPALTAGVDQIAAVLDGATVVPLQLATAPLDTGAGGTPVTAAWQWDDDSGGDSLLLYVATPELLAYFGIATDPAAELLSVHPGELSLVVPWSEGRPEVVTEVEALPAHGYWSVPAALITVAGLERRGWQAEHTGWLLTAAEPLTSEQLAAAREVAAGAGLAVEARVDQTDLTVVAWTMTGVATALALGILAATIGLIRGESTRDLRVLAATGATRRIRRQLTAATAGALALAGALLATGCAYLLVGPLNPTTDLTKVPVLQLALVVAGIPLAAAAGGWLLSGRQPPALARAAIE